MSWLMGVLYMHIFIKCANNSVVDRTPVLCLTLRDGTHFKCVAAITLKATWSLPVCLPPVLGSSLEKVAFRLISTVTGLILSPSPPPFFSLLVVV